MRCSNIDSDTGVVSFIGVVNGGGGWRIGRDDWIKDKEERIGYHLKLIWYHNRAWIFRGITHISHWSMINEHIYAIWGWQNIIKCPRKLVLWYLQLRKI